MKGNYQFGTFYLLLDFHSHRIYTNFLLVEQGGEFVRIVYTNLLLVWAIVFEEDLNTVTTTVIYDTIIFDRTPTVRIIIIITARHLLLR